MRTLWYACHKMVTASVGLEVCAALLIYSGRILAGKT